jgi:O-antigen/teichoic acid export membrane protein
MNEYDRNLTRLVKGGSISAIGDSFSVLSRMLTGIFIAHLFRNPATFGLYILAYRLIFFVRILAVPGTNEGIRRYVPIYRADKNRAAEKGLLIYSLKITAILSSIVLASLMVFSPAITRLFNKPDAANFTRVLALSIPFYAFTMITTSALIGIHRVKYHALTERMIVPGSRLAILLAFLFVGHQTLRNLAVVWSLPLGLCLACSVALFFYLKNFPVLRNSKVKPQYHTREFIKFSLPLAASRPIAYLMNYVGTFIIAYFLLEEDIAQYGVVTRLAPLMIVPLQSAIIAFVPMISELHHLGKNEELAKHFKFISKWILTFSLFIFITCVLLARPILSIFGYEYSGIMTQHTLIVVALAQLPSAAVGPVGMLVSMTGRPRINLYNTMGMLVLNSLLCLVLIPLKGPFGGIVGAGIAQAIAIIGIKTLFLFQVRHYLKMHPFSIGYIKPLIAGLFSGGIMFGIMHISGYHERWVNLKADRLIEYLSIVGYIVIFIAILAILFGFIIYLLGLDETDRFILKKMFFKLRGISSRKPDHGK